MDGGSGQGGRGAGRTPLLGRNFVLASLAYFFVFMAGAVFYLFPLHLEHFGASKARVGLIMGIHSVTAILVRPLFGRLLDEKGGRAVALGGVLLMMLSIPGFYLVGSAGWPVLLLRALNGIGWGVATTAIMAISSECSPPERMAHSLGILGSAGIVAGAAGPALAEELVRRFDFDAVFTASLAMLAATALCVRAVRASRPARAPASVPERAPARAPARAQRFRLPIGPSLAVLLVIAAMPVAHGAVRGSVVNFIALYASGAGLGRIGPFFMAFSLAAILTRLGIGDISDRYGRKRVILPAALLIGLNMFWIASVHSYGAFIVSGFVAGFGQGLIFPALSTYVIDFMGRENKGFALGLYLSLFDVGMGLGSPLFGWVSDVAGYRPMYMAAGGLILVLTVVFHLKAPRIPVPAPR